MTFSVILPLFNKAPYVKKTIESVLNQTYGDFELIIIDDGSTDDSFQVAQLAIGRDSRCKIIHQDNKGVGTARNNGFQESSGEYVCFIDGDDWWAPAFLEKMLWLIGNYSEAGIYGSNYYYVKNGRSRVCVKNAETGYINYCKVYGEGMAMPLTSITVAVRSSVFKEFGGFSPILKLGEDFDLWVRIALKYKVAFINVPLAYYNQDSNPEWRGIRQLHEPQYHMLWNMDYLADIEKTNSDYKQLIDNLRTYGLFPYYLSKQYRNAAKQELLKVNWEMQTKKMYSMYHRPLVVLLICKYIKRAGSFFKQIITQF